MKLKTLFALGSAVVGGAILSAPVQAVPTTLNFGNTTGGQIIFDGADHFTFGLATGPASAANNSFQVTGATAPSLGIGDFGTMTGPVGGWAFNHVTGVVTGTGVLDIEDFGGIHLTADLTWGLLSPNGFGTGGTLNAALTANLSNVTYAGADPDLQAFLAGGMEILSFSFSDNTGHTLLNLGTVPQHTSFSGSLTPGNGDFPNGNPVPDGGLSALLLGLGSLTVEFIRRKMTKASRA
jgi:hypothetical protein